MKNNERKVNKKLISALMAYKGLNGITLGELHNPPVSRVIIHWFLKGLSKRSVSRPQIAEILAPVIIDLKNELDSISSTGIFEALFPSPPSLYVDNKSVGQENLEKDGDNLPESKEKNIDDQRSDG